MWGAAKPTKPIKPVNEMTIEVIKADTTRIFRRILIGSTPVEIANSSPPNDSVFRSHAQIKARGMRRRIDIPMKNVTSKSGRERLPKDQ